jgi:hypothetical protein
MIRPDKYIDLDVSVINISSLILKHIRDKKLLSFDDITNYVVKKIGVPAKENIIYALNFLFLIDKIAYHPNIDFFEFVSNETV